MWYYKEDDQEIGPISNSVLKELVQKKNITGRTLVRTDKDPQWIPLAQRVAKKVQEKKDLKTAEQNITPSKQPQEIEIPQAQQPELATHNLSLENPIVDEPHLDNEPIAIEKPPKRLTLPKRPEPTKRSTLPFAFTGNGSEYFKIWIVNIVLTIITLGIYSAWAKVRKKQYFYGNTKINGTSFNYLANPLTILKGRIIVFIGFVIYSLLQNVNAYAAIFMAVAMVPLLPLFIVKALSFNARNSATRNIRFGFQGTYAQAAKAFLLWPLLVPFTLGLIFPFVYFKQKQFIVDNSKFGTTPFSFTAQPKDYYRIYLRLLLPLIICVVIGLVLDFAFSFASSLIMLVFYLYAIAYISVKNSNLLYNSSQLGSHGFHSSMVTKEYLIIFITNTLATVFTAGFFFPFAEIRIHKYQIENLQLKAGGDLDNFIADEKQQVSALGDEAVEFFDLDIGI